LAILESEQLVLEIGKIVQYDMQYDVATISNMYESFDINLMIKGERLFPENVVRSSYELCGGNIKSLIESIDEIVRLKNIKVEFEFTEPDFEFEIECIINKELKEEEKYAFPETINESLYKFVIWADSGNWNGIYSGTSVGCKFLVRESELLRFKEELEMEYEDREIEMY
jgi:hypothetical protein